jgi:hypothetical protein
MSATLQDVDGFTITSLEKGDPVIQERLAKFLKRYKLPPDTPAMGQEWWGFKKDGRVVLVIGIARRADASIEVTDLYPEPSRDGLRAARLAIDFLKAIVDAKQLRYIVTSVASTNKYMQRFLNKVVGKPACVVYCYNGSQT